MGISIPRPQMRAKERRTIEQKLARHAELMRELEAAGLSREVASAMAAEQMRQKQRKVRK